MIRAVQPATITNDGRITFTPAEAGGTLAYTVDGSAVASYDPSTLSQGSHTVTATQTDAAGNTPAPVR